VFAEVIPSKIFEAMAMGLPLLVAVPAGEATAIVETDGAGIVVPPEDPIALAAAAESLAGDEGLLEILAQQSLAAAPGHSREYQAIAMMAVLEAAATGDGARAAQHLAGIRMPENASASPL
jgi:glycosyltransferase involved in cell wall biosynthesis